MSCQQQGFEGDDDVTRDPHQERLYDEVTALAKLDARHDVDPRTLTDELAALQDEYNDAYTAELCVIANERESN